MALGSVMTQDFFASPSVKGNIALTYLAIKLVSIPFWVHRSGNKGPSPGHPLAMLFSHDSTKSLYCPRWILDFIFSSGFRFLFAFVFDRFLLQLSQLQSTSKSVADLWLVRLHPGMGGLGMWTVEVLLLDFSRDRSDPQKSSQLVNSLLVPLYAGVAGLDESKSVADSVNPNREDLVCCFSVCALDCPEPKLSLLTLTTTLFNMSYEAFAVSSATIRKTLLI